MRSSSGTHAFGAGSNSVSGQLELCPEQRYHRQLAASIVSRRTFEQETSALRSVNEHVMSRGTRQVFDRYLKGKSDEEVDSDDCNYAVRNGVVHDSAQPRGAPSGASGLASSVASAIGGGQLYEQVARRRWRSDRPDGLVWNLSRNAMHGHLASALRSRARRTRDMFLC